MKKFSIFFFLITLALSCFSQSVFNKVYTSDSLQYGLYSRGITQDLEGNIYSTFLKHNGNMLGYVIVKYNSGGDELATFESQNLGSINTSFKQPLLFDDNNNHIIHSYSRSNDSLICIEKLNSQLDLISSSCFNCGASNRVFSMDYLNDSLIFITCTSEEITNPNKSDAHLVLFNLNSASIVWKRNLGEQNTSELVPMVMVKYNQAYVTYRDENSHTWVSIYHIQGFPINEATYPNISRLYWSKNQINQDFLIGAGLVHNSTASINMFKINPSSLLLENSEPIFNTNIKLSPNSVVKNNLLYTTGYTTAKDSSFLLVSDIETGDSLDIKWYQRNDFVRNSINEILVYNQGGLLLQGGLENSVIGPICPWLIRTDQYGCASELCLDVEEVAEEKNEWRIYPNPTNGSFSVTGIQQLSSYTVYSITGKEMLSGSYQPGSIIDVNPLPPGIYFLRMNNQTEKLVRQ